MNRYWEEKAKSYMIEIREIKRNCKCAYRCDTYEEMKNNYCEVPRGEMVLSVDVNPHFVCKSHAVDTLLYMKEQIEEALKVAEELGWVKDDEH